MVVTGIADFGGQRLALRLLTQALSGPCLARIGVASLHHESLNDTMKEDAVVEAAAHKAQEVITVNRGVVIESHDKRPGSCLETDTLAGVLGDGRESRD